jgi:nucleoside-diphosphate-sugar epimerase
MVLVTGAEGYIGVLLALVLMERGHEVVGLDTGFYRDGWLYNANHGIVKFPQLINCDLRRISTEDLHGIEGIVHLAERSKDPLGQNKPENAYQINHKGSVTLAEIAKGLGIERFVYTSSVLNYLSAWAWTTRRIAMTSDGTPWRPLVHVLDICQAVMCALEAPREAVHNEIFNVDRNEDNYRIHE